MTVAVGSIVSLASIVNSTSSDWLVSSPFEAFAAIADDCLEWGEKIDGHTILGCHASFSRFRLISGKYLRKGDQHAAGPARCPIYVNAPDD